MARRKKNKSSPVIPILAVGGGLALVGSVVFAMSQRGSDPFQGLSDLPVEVSRERPSSLAGNLYRLEAVVADARLKWTQNNGTVINVEANGLDIPLLVPSNLSQQNIERNDKFVFKIEMRGGRELPIVHEMKKL